jgi:hypothetical protein
MVMIQYYKDLIATVTYDEVVAWLRNNKIQFKENDGLIKIIGSYEWDSLNTETGKQEFFSYLSRQLNKPIDNIVHEMKNVQQPDISNKYIQQEEIQKRVKTAEQYLMQHKLSNENKEMSLFVAKDIAVMHLETILAKYDVDITYIENVENFLALYYACERLKEKPNPDNIDRLKAITNDQWRKFAEKYNLEFDIDCNDRFNIYKNGKHRLCQQYLYIREVSVDGLEQRRRVFDRLLFFKNILAENISEFEYAQNIHDLITELEGL